MDEIEEQIIPLLILLGIAGVFIALLLITLLYLLYHFLTKKIVKKNDDER
ncbi:MAG: hypothetical protein KAG10_01295 [Methylococcales bacterium]|nr:hypothetical protein [Methylococcales bacterium]